MSTPIRQQLALSSARWRQVTDLVLGIAAGALLVIGLLRAFAIVIILPCAAIIARGGWV